MIIIILKKRMFEYLLCFLISVPFVDKLLTKSIYNMKYLHQFSNIFSKYIIYINILPNIYYIIYIGSYYKLLYRYFIELFIVNFLLKSVFDRPRPSESYLLNINSYIPMYKIILSKNWSENQSFPSGHVTTICLTYFLIYNTSIYVRYIYRLLIILTVFCRINSGSHYVSDCYWALLISHQFKYKLL